MNRNKAGQLKRNLIYNMLYQVLTLIVPFVTAPYISRILGVGGVGEYSFTYSIAHYFVLVIMLGVLNYGNREIARLKDSKECLTNMFWEIYSSQFMLGGIMICIYIIYLLFACEKYRLVSACQGLYVVAGMLDISWFYFGIEKFKFTTSISTLNKIITTLLIFSLVKNENSTYVYACIIAGGTLLNNIAYWLFLNKTIEIKKISFLGVKKHIKSLIILFIPVIAVSIYKYMDKIMLGAMLNTSEVGIYESAEKFINLPMSVIAAIGTVMLPRISNMKSQNREDEIQRYNLVSMVSVMLLACGMTFGLAGISKIFIPWFYGEEFQRSSNVLQILLPTIIFVSWANVIRTQCLLPNKKDKEYCISVIIGAIVNLVINAIYIPIMGALGAAIGTVIAEGSVCILQSFMCRKRMNFIKYIKITLPFFIFGYIMLRIVEGIVLTDVIMSIIVRVMFGVLIYGSLATIYIYKIEKKQRNKKED